MARSDIWRSCIFSADAAEACAQAGEDVILARTETSPEDIHGMHAARGIVTTRGGMTSHAAVVARGMGRPCVAGAGDVRIDYQTQTMTCGGKSVAAGDKGATKGEEETPQEVQMEEVEIRGELERPDVFYIIPRRKATMDLGVLSKDYKEEIMKPLLPGHFEQVYGGEGKK